MELIYYSDNPNLDHKVVETFNDNKEYIINCKRITDLKTGKREYYVMNKDCFFVNNTWYRVSSGLIDFDHENKEWFLKKGSTGLIKGIIGFNPESVYGMFTANPYNNCFYMNRNTGEIETVINQDLLIQNGKVEDFSTSIWYDSKGKDISALQTPKNIVDHTSKGYNIEDNKEEYVLRELLYKAFKPVMSKDVISYGSILGDTTFGLEFECAHGNLPLHHQNRTGVVLCRDGSLKDENGHPGPEFVTIPLKGAKGLQTISTLCKELTKRTDLNLNCSLHIHFGTIPTNRNFLVTLFRLCNKIQNEMFNMFPYYKAQPEGIKNKNYNKKLPSLSILRANVQMNKESFDEYINRGYKQIFTWLAEGYIPDKKRNRKNKKHPAQAKWDRHERYYWVNFMNTIFSDRNTIEFRLHGPTTNAQKTINWLFICNAILKYAINNSHKILLTNCAISLNEVLDYYKKQGSKGYFLSEYLKAYVASRKEQFLKDYQQGDKISKWDYEKDDEYVFTFNNVTNLF